MMAEAFSLQNRFIFCVFQATGGKLGELGTQLRIKMKKTFPSFEVDFGI